MSLRKFNIPSQITDCRAANSTLQGSCIGVTSDFQRRRVSLGAEVEKTPSRVCRYLASKARCPPPPPFLFAIHIFETSGTHEGDMLAFVSCEIYGKHGGSGERIVHLKPPRSAAGQRRRCDQSTCLFVWRCGAAFLRHMMNSTDVWGGMFLTIVSKTSYVTFTLR